MSSSFSAVQIYDLSYIICNIFGTVGGYTIRMKEQLISSFSLKYQTTTKKEIEKR